MNASRRYALHRFLARLIAAPILAVTLQWGVTPSDAIVVDFEGAIAGLHSSYTEEGVRISGDVRISSLFLGNTYLSPGRTAAVNTLTVGSGKVLTVQSVGLEMINPAVPPQSITFLGALVGGGTVSHTFTVAAGGPFPPFDTYAFPPTFTNLTALAWTSGSVVMDDFTVAERDGVSVRAETWGRVRSLFRH